MQKITHYLLKNTPRGVKDVIGKPLRGMFGMVASHDNLEHLGVKHATDKFPNGYLKRYQQHFEARRLSVHTVLEIGIGGYQHTDQG